VRVERVVLEDHGDVAVLGQDVVHDFAVDGDGAAGDFLEARDHPQGGGFAAAGGADEDHEFAVADFQVDAMDNLHAGTLVFGVNFGEIFKGDRGHGNGNVGF